jgi:putative transposase
MKDHTHWLVEGLRDDSALCPFVKTTKQRTGYAFRQRTGCALWQSSYFDVVIRDDVQMRDVVRYIVTNPVRARLVTEPLDYPLWGSGTRSREEILRDLANHPARGWRPTESAAPTL